jgi:uncharacterized protein (TIGR02246 family)
MPNTEDELAIRNALARIAQYADSGDLADYAALFTEDARWEMPDGEGSRTGRAAIRAAGADRRTGRFTGPGSHTRHIVGTVAVTVTGDTAVADSYWQFYGNTDTAPELRSMGAYRDTFVRTPEGWRLAERLITLG